MTSAEEAVIRTIAYSDVFCYPLTREEVYRNLIASRPRSKKEVFRTLAALKKRKAIGQKLNFYFLFGQQRLVEERQKREIQTQLKWSRAKRYVHCLRWLPFVWAIYLTGSVARRNAREEDDLDLLVVTAPDRLWLARPLVWFFLTVSGRRRSPQAEKTKNLICVNLFLAANSLSLPVQRHNLFTAMEIAGARLVWKRSFLNSEPLKAANPWVADYLPQADISSREATFLSTAVKQRWWKSLNNFFYRAQCWYMRPRRTIEEVGLKQVFFHPRDASLWVKREYQERLRARGIFNIIW